MDLLKKIKSFYVLAKNSLPDDSDDMDVVLKNLSKIEAFADRVEYAERNLKHLSSGSSRVVYTLPGKKEVLKLAKNDRGIAQNKVESKVRCKYINKTNDFCKKFCWKTSPYLDKITEKEFKKITNINFKDFGKCLEYGLKDISKNKNKKKPSSFDLISKSNIYKEIVSCAKDNDLMPGDLSRISSWAKLDGKPMLVDAGLTKKIFDEFYVKSS